MSSSSIPIDSEALKAYTESLARSISFASQTVQLLLSLSTAVLAFSITFSKEIAPSSPLSVRRYLATAWLFYFISIPFGIVTMMAFTGLLTEIDMMFLKATNPNITVSNLEDLVWHSLLH